MISATLVTPVSHEPIGYECPFCVVLTGGETPINAQRDIVRQNKYATALVSPRWWPHNKGHVLVISKFHHENIYELPQRHGHAIQDLIKEVAIAIRSTYDCQGVSIRQHNEPVGGQDVWHYHVHVFPRFPHDGLYSSDPIPGFASATERQVYAERLRRYFTNVAEKQGVALRSSAVSTRDSRGRTRREQVVGVGDENRQRTTAKA